MKFKEKVFVILNLFSHLKWSVIATVLTQGLIFATITSVSHVLSVEDYGRLIALQTLIFSLSIFASGGIGATATRYIALYKNKDLLKLNRVISLTIVIILILSLIIGFLVSFFSNYISQFLFNDERYSYLIVVVSFSLFFIVNDGLIKAILIGYGYTDKYAKSCVIGVLPYFPLIYFLSLNYGAYGSVIGLSLSYFFQATISFLYCKQVFKNENYVFSINELGTQLPILLKFSIPAFLSGILVLPANSIVQSFLTRLDDGLFEVAILGIAMQWFNLMQIFPTMLSRVLLPYITTKLSVDDTKGFESSVLMSVLLSFFVSIIIILFFYLVSNHIHMLYNSEYSSELNIIFVALFAGLFKAISAPIGQAILSKGRVWFAVCLNGIWMASFVGGAYVNRESGAEAIMYSFLFAYFFLFLVTAIWFRVDKAKVII